MNYNYASLSSWYACLLPMLVASVYRSPANTLVMFRSKHTQKMFKCSSYPKRIILASVSIIIIIYIYLNLTYNKCHFCSNEKMINEAIAWIPGCPKGVILTTHSAGNSGNNIWEYLSVLAVSELYPEKNFVPLIENRTKSMVEEIFERVYLPTSNAVSNSCLPYDQATTIKREYSMKDIELMPSTRMVVLEDYSCRYEDIIKYGIGNIRKILRFRQSDVSNAQNTLHRIKAISYPASASVTFVGMHYRGGDYIRLLQESYHAFKGISNFRYYNKAMNIFKRRYKHVIFIFVSSEKNWLLVNRRRFDETVHFMTRTTSKVEDMVLLSQCNHTIINYGTFGLTASILTGGTTVVYDLEVPLDHRGMTIAMGVTKLMPTWILL